VTSGDDPRLSAVSDSEGDRPEPHIDPDVAGPGHCQADGGGGELPTGQGNNCVGSEITEIWEDEVLAVVGGFTPATMQAVNRGLAAALGMD
jgi:hypothetical protein